ncbi:glycosyltransferase [Acidocella sp.]|uniref:glycosyltransferase n=1 Tax=Acidocella sp. TaxID=50710 RepID=UPI00260DDD84|nr:glycosyltransferase [Acidocella sp.]
MSDLLSPAHALWRVLPAGPRRATLRRLAAAMAPRADATLPARSRGVVVAGEMGWGTGLGQAARSLAMGARLLGYGGGEVSCGVGRKPRGPAPPPGAALLLAINAPSLPLMLARAERDLLRGRLVIGAWVWELPVVPPGWAAGRRYVHEVWAPSPFAAQALEAVAPRRVRVVPYPLALLPPSPAPPCADVPEGKVVTLMALSLGSSVARKNPAAGIAAFRRAFGRRDDQLLVIKLSGAAADPRAAAQLAAEAGPNIAVFSGAWPEERMAALMERADIVLSPHRAEGFGLVLAEAMLRGKPVVATGWSGNLTFMDQASAALIGYELVPVADASGLYPPLRGARWAEPDIGHMAEWLRRLGDDAALRAALGGRGRAHASACLGGGAMRAALAAHGVAPL